MTNSAQSIANIGDRNGDGVNDLAVGAPSAPIPEALIQVHSTYCIWTRKQSLEASQQQKKMEAITQMPQSTYKSYSLRPLTVDATEGTPTLTLKTKDTDPEMNTDVLYVGGSGSDTLTFEYAVVTGDEATDLDYVQHSIARP